MKRLIVMAYSLLCCAGCVYSRNIKKTNIITQVCRPIPSSLSVRNIRVVGNMHMDIREGEQNGLCVSADEALHPLLNTAIADETLTCSIEPYSFDGVMSDEGKPRWTLTLTRPTLRRIRSLVAERTASLFCHAKLETDDELSLQVSQASCIEVSDVIAKVVKLVVSTASKLVGKNILALRKATCVAQQASNVSLEEFSLAGGRIHIEKSPTDRAACGIFCTAENASRITIGQLRALWSDLSVKTSSAANVAIARAHVGTYNLSATSASSIAIHEGSAQNGGIEEAASVGSITHPFVKDDGRSDR